MLCLCSITHIELQVSSAAHGHNCPHGSIRHCKPARGNTEHIGAGIYPDLINSILQLLSMSSRTTSTGAAVSCVTAAPPVPQPASARHRTAKTAYSRIPYFILYFFISTVSGCPSPPGHVLLKAAGSPPSPPARLPGRPPGNQRPQRIFSRNLPHPQPYHCWHGLRQRS
jgi:hypothetical protein